MKRATNIMILQRIPQILAYLQYNLRLNQAENIVKERFANITLDETQFENEVNSQKLENSYIGLMGRAIEPVIQPLGYDWKIGIALISSFAAREVFLGTLATI